MKCKVKHKIDRTKGGAGLMEIFLLPGGGPQVPAAGQDRPGAEAVGGQQAAAAHGDEGRHGEEEAQHGE